MCQLETFENLMEQYYAVCEDQEKWLEKKRKEDEKEKRERREKREKRETIELKKSRFPDSKILETSEEDEMLVEWLEQARGRGESRNISLLYRGSRDGFEASEFHKRCDSQGPTVVIYRTSDGKRGGGYSAVEWKPSQSGIGLEDKTGTSFLFSLDQRSRYNYNRNTGAFSIVSHAGFGPIFGRSHNGHDLILVSNCNTSISSGSTPSSYSIPSNTALAGSFPFQVDDYEVWKIQAK
eukprot:TRINITY_DN7976_c0_g1_i1.p1 TRINITY_DN7976_c0_g1~~TRINITY_DN7976_c0_g1_i1.p1  ORF type:complete len:275 (-),score=73.72 TRINITY_DN7976_c0_g1_i1:65-775(-)